MSHWRRWVRKLTVAELKDGLSGVIGHDTATAAFHKSTHTDPGKHFPWALFLSIAEEESKNYDPASNEHPSTGSPG